MNLAFDQQFVADIFYRREDARSRQSRRRFYHLSPSENTLRLRADGCNGVQGKAEGLLWSKGDRMEATAEMISLYLLRREEIAFPLPRL